MVAISDEVADAAVWSITKMMNRLDMRLIFCAMLPITSFFAGLFTLYFVRLAFRVIRLRSGEIVETHVNEHPKAPEEITW